MSTATSTNKRVAAALALSFLAAAAVAAQPLATLDLGLIRDSRPVSATLTLTNPSRDRVARVDLLSGCSCLIAVPDRLMLDPGARAAVRVTYVPEGYKSGGEVGRSLFVKSSLPELDNRRVAVRGVLPSADGAPAAGSADCDECRKLEEQFSEESLFAGYADGVVLVDFYADPGCANCEQYLDRELPSVLRGARRQLRLVRRSILEPAELAQLMRRLEGAQTALVELPVAFIGDRPHQGLEAIRAGLRAALGR